MWYVMEHSLFIFWLLIFFISVLPDQHVQEVLAFAPIVVNLSATAPALTSMVITTTAALAVLWYGSSLSFSHNFSRLIGGVAHL